MEVNSRTNQSTHLSSSPSNMSPEFPSLRHKLLRHTNFFGLRLWVLIVVLLASVILVLLFLLCLYHIYCRHRKSYNPQHRLPNSIIATRNCPNASSTSSLRRLLPLEFEAVKQGSHLASDRWSSSSSRIQSLVGEVESGGRWSSASLEAWRGYAYTIKEIELATNGFSDENVIGKGENGVVYRGIMLDNRRIAVKSIIYKSFPMETFITGVEAVRHVRHKNIVRMLGYCVEADHRILVHEYVDNGNLHRWLHGPLGSARPLTWRIRINIIQGIAKGLAYLHDDIEPKIIHGGLKSSNILLDNQWNPKISDAALTTGLLNPHSELEDYSLTSLTHDEKSDVHNFGVLIMEIVTGKPPVIECGKSPVYLVDWLKSMVASKKIEQVVDPTLSDQIINLLELKRVILIALRCVVAEVEHRPKMKDVIHMLEPLDLLLNDKACNKGVDSSNNDGHNRQVEGACNVHVEEEAAITSTKKMLTRKLL